MSERSVEKIVAQIEDPNHPPYWLSYYDLRPLIASWRERGEALKRLSLMSDKEIDIALSVTSTWRDIPGSALTVNREKFRLRMAKAFEVTGARAALNSPA